MFHKEVLFEIGKLMGTLVKIDGYTANRSKLHKANLCVEVDVSKPLPFTLWLKVLDTSIVIKVNYGSVPHYCSHCHKLGHLQVNCLAREKPTDTTNDVHKR